MSIRNDDGAKIENTLFKVKLQSMAMQFETLLKGISLLPLRIFFGNF